LRSILEISQNQNQEIYDEDRKLIMALSPLYLEKLAEVKQEGLKEGLIEGLKEGMREGAKTERRTVIENLLQFSFGSDDELNTIIEPTSRLSPQEFTPLLLQLSRQELLNCFCQQ